MVMTDIECPAPFVFPCIFCGATPEAHTDVRDGLRGHEIRMDGMPQHGQWHPYTYMEESRYVYAKESAV